MAEADQPVAALLRDLSEQTSTLVRKELELARLEMTEKGKRAGIGVGMFGGAGLVGLYALGAVIAAAILAAGDRDHPMARRVDRRGGVRCGCRRAGARR